VAISSKLRFEVFKRDDFTCTYCGRRTPEVILEVDHMIPESRGGTDNPENLVTSCFECNRGKGSALLETILKDRDIHQETVLLAEREIQLAEYSAVKEKVRERIGREAKKLKDYFCKQFSWPPGYAEREFPRYVVERVLEIMSYLDIMDLIDHAVTKTARDSRGDFHNVAAAKYLAAALRNALKRAGKITETGPVEKPVG
jgi:hypothetical protein